MINHLNPPQETLIWAYFAKTLILQGFQPPKNATFSAFLTHFLPINTIPYNEKTQKPLYLLLFRALLFFPVKIGKCSNSIILISIVYAVFCNDRGEMVDKMWKNSFLKALYSKGFKGGLPILILSAYFALTYTFTLGK